MIIIEGVLLSLIVICVLYTLYSLYNRVIDEIHAKIHFYEKRHCNHCDNSYTYPSCDGFRYCPYCGRELTFKNDQEEESND